jgi:hypothetical protein
MLDADGMISHSTSIGESEELPSISVLSDGKTHYDLLLLNNLNSQHQSNSID